ncbi:MAG: ribonuclease III [Planctomycetes bacterium]|jgi:ribonuclease-3|nr:ribonuclease III [Planctomycetota bacterium]
MATLPHEFADPNLMELALTHASTGAAEDNERLEFLGDAVLDLIVAEELYRQRPNHAEGAMTELKAWIVSRRVLADVTRDIGMDAIARIGLGMRNRVLPRSVLANIYEAYLGAVYLDGGLEAARRFARITLDKPLTRILTAEGEPNPKQTLQRHGQLATGEPPTYVVVRERGHAHAKAFLVAAEIGKRRFPSAWGRTLKEAERWAAHEALLVLEEEA